MDSGHAVRLFLVRHGETALTHDDAFCGVTEAPLNEAGREQARQLAVWSSGEQIDALYCSPQGRALETAMPLATVQRLEIRKREALREMNFGRWENRERRDIIRDYPEELALWERGSWMAQPPDGETQQAVLARVVPCIVQILAAHQCQTVLIVSHKTTLRLLTGHLLNMSLPDSRSLKLNAASLIELHIRKDQVHLIAGGLSRSQVVHLQDEEEQDTATNDAHTS